MLKPFLKFSLLFSAVVFFMLTIASMPAPTLAAGHMLQAAGPDSANPVKPTAVSQEKAKKMYAVDCAVCHGDTGNGKTDLGTDISRPTGPTRRRWPTNRIRNFSTSSARARTKCRRRTRAAQRMRTCGAWLPTFAYCPRIMPPRRLLRPHPPLQTRSLPRPHPLQRLHPLPRPIRLSRRRRPRCQSGPASEQAPIALHARGLAKAGSTEQATTVSRRHRDGWQFLDIQY